MDRALKLAAKGISGASPNPMVGCVIVKNGRAIGEGYHSAFGGPHAEINALKDAGNARGAALYINLEPCSHWGKTPPCAEAIVRSGVREVVAAMGDPNPLVRGKGFERLRRAGIRVRAGVGEARARELNRPFVKFITRKKPYVLLKAALSLDGKTATRSQDSKWITSPAARRYSHRLRTEVDAILVGAETVRRDNPSLTSHGLGRDPIRIVVSSKGRLPGSSALFNGKARTVVLHCNAALPPRKGNSSQDQSNRGGSGKGKSAAMKGAEWVYIKPRNGRLDFNAVLSELGRRGVSRLLIEGGAKTLGWALDSGDVDECLFFVAPLLIGGGRARPVTEGTGFAKLKDATRFSEMSAKKIGPDILINARK